MAKILEAIVGLIIALVYVALWRRGGGNILLGM
jgi:hypothetical protein